VNPFLVSHPTHILVHPRVHCAQRLKSADLEDNICGRFNAVAINIFYKTYKSTKSPIVLQNHLASVQKNQISLSNGIIRLITRISKFSCCLYSVKIVCVRSDSVLKSRLFFAKCCHFCRCTKDCCLKFA